MLRQRKGICRVGLGLGFAALFAALAGCAVFQGATQPISASGGGLGDVTAVEASGGNEIRNYPEFVVAATVDEGPGYDLAVGRGYRRLEAYLAGANSDGKSIGRHRPLIASPVGLVPTSVQPVVDTGRAEGWETAIILTDGVTPETAPVPDDPEVVVFTVPAQRIAVRRFRGTLKGRNAAEAQGELAAWVEAQGEAPAGGWQATKYNSSFRVAFRRNEVWIPLR
ncbi:MAG: heme-binding protein [Pseudomonadota bacterium]